VVGYAADQVADRDVLLVLRIVRYEANMQRDAVSGYRLREVADFVRSLLALLPRVTRNNPTVRWTVGMSA
jgi:hypothetical protein